VLNSFLKYGKCNDLFREQILNRASRPSFCVFGSLFLSKEYVVRYVKELRFKKQSLIAICVPLASYVQYCNANRVRPFAILFLRRRTKYKAVV
jgi:hypothetical protein